MKSFSLSNKKGLVISLVNPDASSGKTTAVISIAESFAQLGHRVLMIDCDFENNLTQNLSSFETSTNLKSLFHILSEQCSINDAIYSVKGSSLKYVPAGTYLNQAENDIFKLDEYLVLMRAAIEEARKNFDCIIIDTPSELGTLASLGMLVSDIYLIPLKSRDESLLVIQEVEKIEVILKKSFGCAEFGGAFFSMLLMEDKYASVITNRVKASIGDNLIQTQIPYSTTSSKRRMSYAALVNELLGQRQKILRDLI